MASIIIGYGLLLAALGMIVQLVTPKQGTIASIAGITGGGLCLLCGIVACVGHKRRVWIVLTVVVIIFVLLSQTVHAWMNSTVDSGSVALALVLTLMLLLTLGLLTYVLHGERPPEFYTAGTARENSSPSRGKDAHSDRGGFQSK